jgi:acetyl-CoA synthetase
MPKTRSGKVVRRLLRSVAKGEVIVQDTSTVENPAVISQFADAA